MITPVSLCIRYHSLFPIARLIIVAGQTRPAHPPLVGAALVSNSLADHPQSIPLKALFMSFDNSMPSTLYHNRPGTTVRFTITTSMTGPY